jgi:hypothetical protein
MGSRIGVGGGRGECWNDRERSLKGDHGVVNSPEGNLNRWP